MFKNYVTVSLRNVLRNKTFSFITILGLAIGISASLVVYLIIQFHTSFDHFHKDRDRLYRVVTDFQFSGEEAHIGAAPHPLYDAVKTEVTGVQASTAFFTYRSSVQIPETGQESAVVFKKEDNIAFTDDNYFRLFPHKWLAGSADGALQQPFATVISEKIAKKYFPQAAYQAILGRQIIYDDSIRTTVQGIVQDWTTNSDLVFNQFISLATARHTNLKSEFAMDEWDRTHSSSQLFMKLSPQTAPSQVEGQIKKLTQKYRPDTRNKGGNTDALKLQPISNLHFDIEYGSFGQPMGFKSVFYSLGAAALFLLLLGCINFINLTTAQSVQRAKEIGIRKTMGGSKMQLVAQFLSETFFITLLATLLSVALIPWILNVFSAFVPDGLQFDIRQQPGVLLFLLALTLLVTFLSGFYPALILSRYKPVAVLKNQVNANAGLTRKAWLRKTLTVSQFVIAQVFIMGTALVSKQIHYGVSKDLGFKKEAILSLSLPSGFNQRMDAKLAVLQTQIQAMPQVSKVSVGGPPPASDMIMSQKFTYTAGQKEVQANVELRLGDTNYLDLYGIRLLAGRNVKQSDTTTEMIINETYLHKLGFQKPEEAIGKMLAAKQRQFPIVGVMADFHQRSLHEPIQNMAFSCDLRNSNMIHLALRPQTTGNMSWQDLLATIEKTYKKLYPKDNFQYTFFDESIAKLYKSDEDMATLLHWATALSIIISCLGLLGLVIYTTNQRTKEIGIRKVMGASVAQLVTLLSKDFLLLVVIAFVIAVPVAWWGMQQYLQKFAYRTPISWGVFAASGLGMLLLALVVLSTRTIKAARANPVKNLHTE